MKPYSKKACGIAPRLFDELARNAPNHLSRANLGTFQDSLRAPVHRWFTYPAGFSYQAVQEAFRFFDIRPGMRVYDPFAGTGTTLIVAKQHGVNSFGVEAHPFVQFVARTKLYWEFEPATLLALIEKLISRVERALSKQTQDLDLEKIFPELVRKCYGRKKLGQLYLCREAVNSIEDARFQDFARLALTNLLRAAADVATGWPYIAPKKEKNGTKANGPNVVDPLRRQLYQMRSDLLDVRRSTHPGGAATLIAGDSRERQDRIRTGTINLAFTSPPYLNNYDYADRTRLETYFWGEAKTWGDITRTVRARLIMSATTQINRTQFDEGELLSNDFRKTAPEIASDLTPRIAQLSELRHTKGGKKSYDIMVAGYFNDMLRVMRETYRVLKADSRFVLILGDSAPYGVYIPTDTYLGEIGKAVGFESYEVEVLRSRGGKWKDNPQRHSVPLKECILTLHKK